MFQKKETEKQSLEVNVFVSSFVELLKMEYFR